MLQGARKPLVRLLSAVAGAAVGALLAPTVQAGPHRLVTYLGVEFYAGVGFVAAYAAIGFCDFCRWFGREWTNQ